MTDKLHEECGVVGVFDTEGGAVAQDIYKCLYALQHRGQESCGIVTNDDARLSVEKSNGLVSEVLEPYKINRLNGDMGVGHVRYAKTSAAIENVQPLVSRYCKGSLTLSFNGNITNAEDIRHRLEMNGAIFQSTSNAEVIMNLVAIARTKSKSVEVAVLEVMKEIRGAYSLVIMSPRKLIAVRDPRGFHPLVLGQKGGKYVVVSETCALDAIGAKFVRDIAPGEVLKIERDGLTSFGDFIASDKRALCAFEMIYFSRPDSYIDGESVFMKRLEIGKALARACPCENADLVIGTPDSGLTFALGYSYESGILYGDALIRNRYTGREFIKHTQKEREDELSVKLNPVRAAIEGKNVVLVDDSIVRGTSCTRVISMLFKAGAKSVHMRVASPAFDYECFFGTDIPSRDQLIAHGLDNEAICRKIGATSLGYLPLEKLREILGEGYCDGCYCGKYPKGAINEK